MAVLTSSSFASTMSTSSFASTMSPFVFPVQHRSRSSPLASPGLRICKAQAAPVNVPGAATPAEELIRLPPGLHRSHFPKDFVFGAASCAFQFEGALDAGGRKPSIWDEWTKVPGKIADGSSPQVTCGQYYHYKEHVQFIKSMGMDAYRLSISWTRLLDPTTGRLNLDGLHYYNSFIHELLDNGIEPYVTLYHWDLPQAFQEAPTYGWLSKDGTIVQKFVEYADLCFSAFGQRVKKWTTFNEPWSCVNMGYVNDTFPPGVTNTDDPTKDPYTATHNILLAHAAVVEMYRKKYQKKQKGQIGITLNSMWSEPLFDTTLDVHAAQRSIDFELGWYLHPIVYGKYPDTMVERVGSRLPTFTKEESERLKGSMDFLGLNYYSSKYVRELDPSMPPPAPGYNADMNISVNYTQSGVLIGPFPPEFSWMDGLPLVPWGFFKLLNYINDNYKAPKIYITENGTSQKDGPVDKVKDDDFRLKYFLCHIDNMRSAMKAGIKLRGYFAWALLDNWEWNHGYTVLYGQVYVDKSNPDVFAPTEKKSAKWYREFLKT